MGVALQCPAPRSRRNNTAVVARHSVLSVIGRNPAPLRLWHAERAVQRPPGPFSAHKTRVDPKTS